MPPKKKGGSKGPKKSSSKKDKKSKHPIVIEDVVTNELSREEIETYIVKIRQELERERVDRNYFQLERDKIHSFWQLKTKQLEEAKLELRNKDRSIEEAEENHQLELKIFRQKMKQLMYGHQNAEAETMANAQLSIEKVESATISKNVELTNYTMKLKNILRQKELETEEAYKQLRRQHESENTNLREDFINKSKLLESSHQVKMKKIETELNLRRKNDIHEIEERKNYQIKTLIDNHDEKFRAMKGFYNDITLNNFNVIKTLRETIDGLRKKLHVTTNNLELAQAELKKKNEYINSARTKLSDLDQSKKILKDEKEAHKICKGHVKRLTTENKDLILENEILLTQFSTLSEERSTINRLCETKLLELQQKTGLKNLLLEKKLNELKENLEKKDLLINEILSSVNHNLDKDATEVLTKHIEDVIDNKNDIIKKLEYELARNQKTNIDLKNCFESYLNEVNQFSKNLGLEMIETKLNQSKQLGKGPAGLVSVAI